MAILAATILSLPASAAGIDSRAFTCTGLQSFVAAHGFVFISQATFGDFVVANRSFCADDDVLETRSVATSDTPECLVNYCVSRSTGSLGGSGGM
ncbi:MAG TPA: hypothetical protein VNF04_16980 [Stellaceae bacterium]|nr:hypothetical protein [Stellaceae bacterium]